MVRRREGRASCSGASGPGEACKVGIEGLRAVAVNAPHLVALVRAGAVFTTQGKLVRRPDDQPQPQSA